MPSLCFSVTKLLEQYPDMKRILILLGSHGHGSGAERVLEYLLAGAVAQRDAICLLAPESSSVTAFARNLGYEWIPWECDHDGLCKNFLAFCKFLRAHERASQFGLVHSWHTRHLEWAWLLGRLWKIPCSGTIHDDPCPTHEHFGPSRKWIIRSTAERLDGVVAVSSAIANRCSELGWKRPLLTIRNGLPDAAPVRQKDSLVLRLGFLATTVLWKGVTLLPELVRRTADLPLEWHLFGSPLPETVPFVEKLTLASNVYFHGRVPLEEALSHTDILLHFSQALDPYPTVLLEAARAGLPVIATCTGGSPEIVREGITGLLVPSNDIHATEMAIRRLVQEPHTRRAMGEAARIRFESEFRVERMVADYFSFWDGLRSPRA